MYTEDKVKEIINLSLDELYLRDSSLIFKDYNLHERSITHRLAIYIEKHFGATGYVVDVEYNRMRNKYGEDIIGNAIGKVLDLEKFGKDICHVYPDKIVHKRDTNNNLIEIEVKMEWKSSKKEFDYIKINNYISQLGYKYGLYVELSEKRQDCIIAFGPFDL